MHVAVHCASYAFYVVSVSQRLHTSALSRLWLNSRRSITGYPGYSITRALTGYIQHPISDLDIQQRWHCIIALGISGNTYQKAGNPFTNVLGLNRLNSRTLLLRLYYFLSRTSFTELLGLDHSSAIINEYFHFIIFSAYPKPVFPKSFPLYNIVYILFCLCTDAYSIISESQPASEVWIPTSSDFLFQVTPSVDSA